MRHTNAPASTRRPSGHWAKMMGALAVGSVVAVGCGDDGGSDDRNGSDADGGDAAVEQEDAVEAAPAGLAQVVMPEDVELEADALEGRVGTETMLLSLVGTAELEVVGVGRAARRPDDGEMFLAVELEKQPVPINDVVSNPERSDMDERGAATFSVQVDDGDPVPVELDVPGYTPLPIDLDDPPGGAADEDADEPRRRVLLVSVPTDAEAVDLVVSSEGLEQRLSLLTGEPGEGTVAVLARENRSMPEATSSQDLSLTATDFGLTFSSTESVSVAAASLEWTVSMRTPALVAESDGAYLQIMMDLFDVNWTLASELELPDGTVVQPEPWSEEDEILAGAFAPISFAVPADFTTGTLVVGKDYTWEVPTGGTKSIAFGNQASYTIETPLE